MAQSSAATTLSVREIQDLCALADGPQHCGRLIERAQLQRYPHLAERNGDTLTIPLKRGESLIFKDSDPADASSSSIRYYSVWAYLQPVDYVVLFEQGGKHARYRVIHTRTGRQTELPDEPVLSPDRLLLATADLCAGCSNEIALWEAQVDRPRKIRSFRLTSAIDGDAAWKDHATLTVTYVSETKAKDGTTEQVERVLELKLTDSRWMRHD